MRYKVERFRKSIKEVIFTGSEQDCEEYLKELSNRDNWLSIWERTRFIMDNANGYKRYDLGGKVKATYAIRPE